MEGLSLGTVASSTANSITNHFFSNSILHSRRRSVTLIFSTKPKKFAVFASNGDKPPLKLNQWEQMELKFGRLMGEDPKLTLAKIMGKRSNPDMSYLEIEESFRKNKGKVFGNDIEEVPFDVSTKRGSLNSKNELNLVRPVPKEGFEFDIDDKEPIETREIKQSKQISRPVENSESSVPNVILRKPTVAEENTGSVKTSSFGMKPNLTQESIDTKEMKPSKQIYEPVENSKSSVPNVTLRKPTVYSEEDTGSVRPSRFRMKPNLTLNMRKEPLDMSDMTLLKKPEPIRTSASENEEDGHSSDAKSEARDDIGESIPTNVHATTGGPQDVIPLKKPEPLDLNQNNDQEQKTVDSIDEESLNLANAPDQYQQTNGNYVVEHPRKGLDQSVGQSFAFNSLSGTRSAEHLDAALLGKPERLDQTKKSIPQKEVIPANYESNDVDIELDNFLKTSTIKDHEDNDWTSAENLVKTGERKEVELISSSTRGFVVSFGSLIGYLPYRNLATNLRFMPFESWLRSKGLDPSTYKQNLGVIRDYDDKMIDSSESRIVLQIDNTFEVSPDMKLEKLLSIFDQEKLKFLTSFVGQTVKVNVVLADRKSRRLIVSMKHKENEEMVQKKRSLMAKLRIGDVVKCCIKKITYFGIFVEVEGVPALVHQAEVSWDAMLDPASYYRIGQIVDARVHQLDFSLDRIFLSLREITPDPMTEALEAIVGDQDNLDGNFETAQPDAEWADVESLIRELQQFEGISSVSKGRYFLSPGLAPTFQVYMASSSENQYKLLARSGNQVQEVIVQTSLSKEEMKSAILICTNKVE
nr:30S Ribosomal protein [Ipomoea batatas]